MLFYEVIEEVIKYFKPFLFLGILKFETEMWHNVALRHEDARLYRSFLRMVNIQHSIKAFVSMWF